MPTDAQPDARELAKRLREHYSSTHVNGEEIWNSYRVADLLESLAVENEQRNAKLIALSAMFPNNCRVEHEDDFAHFALTFQKMRDRLEVFENWKQSIEDSGDKDGWARACDLQQELDDANGIMLNEIDARNTAEHELAALRERLEEAERGLNRCRDRLDRVMGDYYRDGKLSDVSESLAHSYLSETFHAGWRETPGERVSPETAN